MQKPSLGGLGFCRFGVSMRNDCAVYNSTWRRMTPRRYWVMPKYGALCSKGKSRYGDEAAGNSYGA